MWNFLGNVVGLLTGLGILVATLRHPLTLVIVVGILCLAWKLCWNDR